MFDMTAALTAFITMLLFAVAGWILSVLRRDTGIVDSLWSLFFLIAAGIYAASADLGPRSTLLLTLITLWALRLSGYITYRNWNQPEDRRYQAIRARNQPGFAWKSLYLVFLLQAVLSGVIAVPLLAGLSGANPLGLLDYAGVTLWLIGFGFETIGDWQLARFKANPDSQGQVLNTGLWRYTRHPNYFGEATLWWGYYLIALSAGGGWTIFAPVLMTVLLLKVSGVTLLEQDIGNRRPAYREYIARTNAFIPGRPKEVI
ncbi:MAG: DUF1295 domain-containing protein [Gammaproteobacteria bacterium]|nr:DUF1295 domain-containing protein [Gammaproteobacteria bacterium]